MPLIYQLPMQVPGMVGVFPNQKFMVSGDNLATVTTAGYLNQVSLESNPVSSTDVIQCLYSFNIQSQTGSYAIFTVSISNGIITLVLAAGSGEVVLPTIANHIATYTNVSGGLSEDPATAISGGNIQAGLSGTAGFVASFPSAASKGSLRLTAVANTGDTLTTLSNVAMGQASVVSIPDPANALGRVLVGATATPFVSGNFPQNSGTGGLMVDSGIAVSALATSANVVLLTPAADQSITIHNLSVAQGNLAAGSSGHAGTVSSFPGTAANGSLILAGVNAGGAFNTTISNSTMGQASVVSIPDPGTATSKFLLQDGVNTVVSVANLKYGATPVAQVDPASCTITAVAGAANTATITVQLKDGSGTNMTRIIPFRVYSSSTADGLTLQSAASTGYSVASGGLSLNNGEAITTQISCMSSATGGCVLSLLDTGKQTSYLVLQLPSGVKISAQLSSGSYG